MVTIFCSRLSLVSFPYTCSLGPVTHLYLYRRCRKYLYVYQGAEKCDVCMAFSLCSSKQDHNREHISYCLYWKDSAIKEISNTNTV